MAGVLADILAGDVWSRAVGSPGSVFRPDTPRLVLQLLQAESTKRLLTYGVLLVTARLYKQRRGARSLDPTAFPTSQRQAGRRRALRAVQRQMDPPRQHTPDPSATVDPWHSELEAAMRMEGCMGFVLGGEEDPDGEPCQAIHPLAGVMCCIGATLAARGEARMSPTSSRVVSTVSRSEALCDGHTRPFIKVREEARTTAGQPPFLLCWHGAGQRRPRTLGPGGVDCEVRAAG